MDGKTAKLISPERVRQLFECYGANPDSWPLDEKVAALSLIQHSSELKQLQQETAEFDRLLKAGDVSSEIIADTNQGLLKNIVNVLPEQDVRQNSKYINRISQPGHTFFDINRMMGAIAASVALMVISFSIVSLTPESVTNSTASNRSASPAIDSELEGWMWQQVAGEPAEDLEDPLTMMALLELEE